VVLAFAIHAWSYADLFIDDAFIALRYVRQWEAGNGLVYNIGEPVEGYSSFLWVVLLRASRWLGLDLVVAARVLGIGFAVATLVLVQRFARRLPRPLLSPVLLAISAPFAAWSAGGLETPLFMFLVFVGTWLSHREQQQARGWSSGLLWGLAALTRPEGLLFGVLAFACRGLQLGRCRRWPTRHDHLRIVAFVSIVVPHLVWRLVYYGYPLPNTVYAKAMGFHLRPLLEGGYYLHLSAMVLGGLPVVALLVLLALRGHERYPYVAYFTLNIAAYAVTVVVAGGDWMPAQRFLAHVLPLVVLVLHAGSVELLRLLSSFLSNAAAHAGLGVYVVSLASVAVVARFVEPAVPDDHRLSRPYAWIAHVEQRVSEGDTIAVLDAGRVAYELPLGVRIVDVVGLTDGHIAHLDPQLPSGLLGRGDAWGKWDIDYVLAQKPLFVQMHIHGLDDEGNWRTGFTGTTLLANAPEFRERYRPTELTGLFRRVEDPVAPPTPSSGTAADPPP
jgi:arabinofuranosyltransferase